MTDKTETTTNTLTGIIDDYREIKLGKMSQANEHTVLFISIDEGIGNASFFFDGPHEAQTFLTRALHQVGLFMEKPTPAEILKAEIYAFQKVSTENEYHDTGQAIELLERAAQLL